MDRSAEATVQVQSLSPPLYIYIYDIYHIHMLDARENTRVILGLRGDLKVVRMLEHVHQLQPSEVEQTQAVA